MWGFFNQVVFAMILLTEYNNFVLLMKHCGEEKENRNLDRY